MASPALVPLVPLELVLPRGPGLRGLRLVPLRPGGPELLPLRLVTLSSSKLVLLGLRGPRLVPWRSLLVPHMTRGRRMVPLREARQSPTTSLTLFTAKDLGIITLQHCPGRAESALPGQCCSLCSAMCVQTERNLLIFKNK